MNILFLSFNQEGRGTYLRAFLLARELVKKGHRLTLCCASGSNRFEEKQIDGVKVVSFPYGHKFLSGWNISEVKARINWLKNQYFDIVHTFEMRPTCSIPALRQQKKGAALFTDWADWFGKGGSIEERTSLCQRLMLRPFETFFERHFRGRAIGTTVICDELMKLALSIGLSPNSLQTLPNGFNQSSTTPLSVAEARALLNMSSKQYILGFLGSFFPRDFDLLSKTIELIRSKRDDVQLLHIGQTAQQQYLKSVPSTGPVDEVELRLYLQACDILLLPMYDSFANRGRFPLKFSDYLSSGRPVVTTNVGDVPKIVSEFQVGIVAQPKPNAMKDALLGLLGHEECRNKYGENAWALSRRFGYRWEDKAEQLLDFYQERIATVKLRVKQMN